MACKEIRICHLETCQGFRFKIEALLKEFMSEQTHFFCLGDMTFQIDWEFMYLIINKILNFLCFLEIMPNCLVFGFVSGAQNFDVIRFATYRTACKLRFIQKKTNCE